MKSFWIAARCFAAGAVVYQIEKMSDRAGLFQPLHSSASRGHGDETVLCSKNGGSKEERVQELAVEIAPQFDGINPCETFIVRRRTVASSSKDVPVKKVTVETAPQFDGLNPCETFINSRET